MNNTVFLIGRVVNQINQDGVFTLAVQRNYKNEDGIYETDFIDIKLNNYQIETAQNYIFKGDLVGIKGELRTSISNNGIKTTEVKTDRMTFLSSKKGEK